MEKSMRPSAITSRKLIVNALLKLMQSKEYSKITVSDVVKEAQVARKTFYNHFYLLDDVLNEYVSQLLEEYLALVKKRNITNIYEHVPVYFEFWSNHFEFLEMLHKNSIMFFLLNQYMKVLPEVFKLLPCDLNKSQKINDYFLAYTAGGFLSILQEWIKNNGEQSPKEMADIFKNFFSQIVIGIQ